MEPNIEMESVIDQSNQRVYYIFNFNFLFFLVLNIESKSFFLTEKI